MAGEFEYDVFLSHSSKDKERRFIPLRLDDTRMKGSLAQFLSINWRPTDQEQEYLKLLDACRLDVDINPSACEFVGMRIVARGTAHGGERVVVFHRIGDETTPEGRRYWCSGTGRLVGNAWEVRIDCLRNRRADHRYLLAVLCKEPDASHIVAAAEAKAVDNVSGLMGVIGRWVAAKSREVLLKRTGKPG